MASSNRKLIRTEFKQKIDALGLAVPVFSGRVLDLRDSDGGYVAVYLGDGEVQTQGMSGAHVLVKVPIVVEVNVLASAGEDALDDIAMPIESLFMDMAARNLTTLQSVVYRGFAYPDASDAGFLSIELQLSGSFSQLKSV